MFSIEVLGLLLSATIQAGTPILLATLGEIITEKGGILNLGVEGMMAMGAFMAFLGTYLTHNPWAGFVLGGLGACFLAFLHGVVCLIFRGNQVVSGLAITVLGLGLANFLGTPYVGIKTVGFDKLDLPLLKDIPFLGEVFFKQDVLVYFSLLLAPVLYLLFEKTRFGLRLKAVGENPYAARARGIKVFFYQWVALLSGAFLVGVAGSYLSLAYTHVWTNGLTAGRGWIAVALVIFAFWRPFRAIWGAYLFGGVMALQLRIQALGSNISSSLLLMLPYLLTIGVLLLACFKKKGLDAPAHLGLNIEPKD
ncbi:MAG: ral nucleoside transport system permease protein [Desulfonauticus sp.]|nr:ral nucleoside transport system permease protein [Desulfonauticus sp.]